MKMFLPAVWLLLSILGVGAAPEATTPVVPAVLAPLKAKVDVSGYGWKGPTLSFRAETPPTPEQWKAIEGLGLRNFSVAGPGITNDSFSQLAKQEPEGLSLNATALTDDGFKALASMKSLKVLNILHTVRVKDGFTGAGFAQLKSLPKLYKVSFAGSSAREPAFVALGELTQLTEFHSWHSEYGDPTNPYLLNFKNLETLRMGNSLKRNDGTPRQLSLSDVTLSTIAQLSNLKTLTLMEAKFSLPALMQLKSLPKLKTLIFVNVDISEADFEKLRSALPNVKVTGKPLDEAARTKLSVFLK